MKPAATFIMATAFTAVTSLAFAQPAPIGSSADSGNGAVINRGPATTTGEDLVFEPIDPPHHGWRRALGRPAHAQGTNAPRGAAVTSLNISVGNKSLTAVGGPPGGGG